MSNLEEKRGGYVQIEKHELNQNSKENLSFIFMFKNCFLIGLPHLSILLLFILYALIGAAILKEIETESSFYNQNELATFTNRENCSRVLIPFSRKQFDFNLLQIKKLQIHRQQHEKFNQDFDKFLISLNELIGNYFSKKAKQDSESEMNGLPVNNSRELEKETLKIISIILEKESKNANLEILKEIAKHLISLKTKLKEDFSKLFEIQFNNFKHARVKLDEKISNLLNEQDAHLKESNKYLESMQFSNEQIENDQKREKVWTFFSSLNFVVAFLSTIGHGEFSTPETLVGKLFTTFYLVIGLPLTLILLTDFNRILTRFMSFLFVILTMLFKEGYYDQILISLKKKRNIVGFLLNILTYLFGFFKIKKHIKPPLVRAKSIYESSDRTNDNSDEKIKNEEEMTFSKLTREILIFSFYKSKEKFEFPLSFVISLVFLYWTLGALLGSKLNDYSLFDSYYYSLLAFAKIEMNNLKMKHCSSLLIYFIFVLFGLSLFSLMAQHMQAKLYSLLVKSGQNVIMELIKFLNQLGYDCKMANLLFSDWNYENKEQIASVSNESGTDDETQSDEEDLFVRDLKHQRDLPNMFSKKTTLIAKSRGKRRRSIRIIKIDKQTQITTLLCSKIKMDQSNSDSGQVAFVKPRASVEENISELNDDDFKANQRIGKQIINSQLKKSNLQNKDAILRARRISRFAYDK